MQEGNVQAILNAFENEMNGLERAAGAAVAVEMRMRMIGECSEDVRKKLKELVEKAKAKKTKCSSKKSVNYWDCDLCYLDDAIAIVFKDDLTADEREKVDKFRRKRNALLHSDFVKLMELLGIPPTGRNLTGGKRNILQNKDIKESFISVTRNQGLVTFQKEANAVKVILEKIILKL